jgi:dephospho-CoA kinase
MFKHGTKPVIGLIGGIGAGKSSAARCFAARGGWVIDGDAIGHEVLRQPAIVARLVERWGPGVQKPDGSLDRREIGRIVFTSPSEREALEELVFPEIGQRCREEIQRGFADASTRFVVLDAAVMLEAGWNNAVDRIVYVDAPREVRLARLTSRSGWMAEDLAAREAAQWPEEVKQSRSDAVILNNADLATLQSQVDQLLRDWGLLPTTDASEKRPG